MYDAYQSPGVAVGSASSKIRVRARGSKGDLGAYAEAVEQYGHQSGLGGDNIYHSERHSIELDMGLQLQLT